MALKVGELFASFGIDTSAMDGALKSIEDKSAQLGKTLALAGAGMTLALTAPIMNAAKDMVQAAIDYESAFAGVRKTTDELDLTAAGMSFDSLSESIKKMSLEIPLSAEGLAKIMELGSQLGIDVTSLESFTETIAAIGVATNLTTEEASTMFAQFANITGMDQSQFSNLGSTIVALGNNFATTEKDIMEMGMRMASVGETVGLTEAQTLAFAATLASTGMKAQLGGSAFGTFSSNLMVAVETGSDALKDYAAVAGVSADVFAKAFKDDAAGAIQMFVKGLSEAEGQGKSAIVILEELGITEIGQRTMLLNLANSYDVLTEALAMSGGAWEDNVALMNEANQRYATTESQLSIMRNAIQLVKVDLGEMSFPYIKDMVANVISLTQAFLALSDEQKIAGVKFLGVTAAAGPVLTILGGLVATAGHLVPILASLASPLAIVGAGLAVFAFAAVDANNDIGKAMEDLSGSAKKSLAEFGKTITDDMKKISKRMPAVIGSIITSIKNVVPGMMDVVLTGITGFIDSISDNAQGLADIGMEMITSITGGISRALPTLIPSVVRIVTSIASALITNLPKIFASAVEMGKAIWDGIKNIDWVTLGTQLWEAIKSAWNGISAQMTQIFNDLVTAVKEIDWAKLGSDIWNWIKGAFTTVGGWLTSLITGDAKTPIYWTTLGDSIWNWIKGAFTTVSGWLRTLITGDAKTPINWTTLGTDVWNWISGAFDNAVNWLRTVITGDADKDINWTQIGTNIWNWIKGAFTDAANWLSTLITGDALTEANWTKVGGDIWEWIKCAFAATTDFLYNLIIGDDSQKLTWESAGKKMGGWVSDAFETATTQITTWLGITKLTYDEVKAITDSYTVPKALEMTELVTAKENVTNLATEVGNLQTQITSEAMKVKLGVELVGTDATTFAGMVDDLIETGISTIEASAYEVNLTISTLFGDGSTTGSEMMTNLFDPYFEQIEASAAGAGEKARAALVSALADEKITPAEAAKIQILTQQFTAEIERSLAQNEIEAKALRLRVENGGDGLLNPADIANIARQIMEQTQLAVNTLVDSESSVIDIAYRAAAALEFDPTETAKYIESIRLETQNMVANAEIGAINWTFDLLTDQLTLPDLSSLFAEGKLSMQTSLSGWMDVITTAAPGFRERTAALLKEMAPSIVELNKIKTDYEAAGLAVPESVTAALTRASALTAVQNGVAGVFGWLMSTQGLSMDQLTSMTTEQLQGYLDLIETTLSTDVKVADSVAGMWNDVFAGSLTSINSWRPELETQLRALGVDVGALLGVALPEGVAKGLADGTITVKEAAAQIAALAAVGETGAAAAVKGNEVTGLKVGTGLATGEDSAKATVTTSSEGLTAAVENAVEPIVETVTGFGTDATIGMGTAIDDNKGTVVTAMDTLADEVVKAAMLKMSAATGTTIGSTYVNAIRDAITSAGVSLNTAAKTVADAAKSMTSGILTYDAGSTIGSQFTSGIAAGIRNGTDAIRSAARAAALSALTSAKTVLGINSPSRVAEDEVGDMFDRGVANGLLKNMGLISGAAGKIKSALTDSFYLSDPSRGTVYTSRESIQQTADKTAQSTGSNQSELDRAATIGRAIADRLVESGVLHSDIYMDKDKVGEKVSQPVSTNIRKAAQSTITGRSLQGVIA